MENAQDVGILFQVDDQLEKDPEYEKYINYHVEENEKEAIYKAVKQAKDNWICIKVKTEKRKLFSYDKTDYVTKVNCRAVQTQNIYIPVYSEIKTKEVVSMPKDVYLCKYCGGYTKNDRRGNCAACGAGRTYDK